MPKNITGVWFSVGGVVSYVNAVSYIMQYTVLSTGDGDGAGGG